MGGVEYQVTKVDPTDPHTKGAVYQVHKVSEEVAATLGGKVYRARIINDPTAPTVAGKVYQIVLIGDPADPAVKGKVYNAILTGGSEAVVIGPAVSPLSLPDAVANSLQYVKAFGGTEQRNLPAGYTQVEYLESTGTQYIDTGYTMTSDVVEYGIRAWRRPPNATSLFGSESTNAPNYSGVPYSSAGTMFAFIGRTTSAAGVEVPADQWYDYVLKTTSDTQGVRILDNDERVFAYAGGIQKEYPIYLFANNRSNSATQTSSVRVASFYIKDNGVLVRNLIPCRQNSNNVLGMYDTVSGQFFTNAGTGVFTAGADVVPSPDTPVDIVSNNGVLKARHQSGLPLGYTALESVNNDGTGWLDLGMPIGSADIITFDIEWNENVASPFFGAYEQNGSYSYLSFVGTYYNNPNSISFYANGPSPIGIVTKPTGRCLLKWNGVSAKPTLDGSELGSANPPYNNYTPNVNAYLFTRNQGGTAGSVDNITMYGFSVERNGVIISNLVPAKRNSDNVVGMYDTIRGLFLTSAGTGDFDAGNAVSDPVEIYTDGTVETISVHGKNLFDISQPSTKQTISSGIWRKYNVPLALPDGAWTCKYMPNISAGTYTLSANSPWFRIVFFDGENATIIATVATRTTFTLPSAGEVWIFCATDSAMALITEAQLELGSTATPYEPYYNGGTATAEMLLKVGDYADEQEILSGAVTRKVGVLVLDGTESWAKTGDTYGFALSQATYGYVIGATVMCNQYPYSATVSSGLKNVIANTSGAYALRILTDDTVIDTSSAQSEQVTQFKQFLANKYAAGTPIIILYPLEEPTTESVAGQELQVQAGDNVVEVTQASIDTLELEAQYEKEAD